MDIHELLAKVTDDSGRAIAKKVGLPERTVLHQISTGRMPLDNVIKITAAYGYSPIRALIDLGELDATWSQVPDVEAALRLATDEQLTDEFLRRLKAAPNPEWNAPVGDIEAARRAKKSHDRVPPRPGDEEDVDGALREANNLQGAAQRRTPTIDEPENP